jgi:Putative transposase
LDPRRIGGRVAMVGVLQTWPRDLLYPPHLHDRVAGGGLSGAGNWLPSREDFLVHVKPLSVIFQATCRDHLKKTDLFAQVDEHVWQKDWVVHCQPVGSGEQAFRYLAPDIFRVAISHKRLLKLEDGHVTFQYKESATDQTQFCTLTAEEFIRRFLPHVLPDRFINVRYDGLRSPSNRHVLNRTRPWLAASAIATKTIGTHPCVKQPIDAPRCPHCGSILILVQTLRPNTRSPP